jgi:RNA polymerase sigma factor (sigma-70 family)
MASGALRPNLKHLRDLFGGGTAVGLGDGELLRRYAGSHDGPAFEALVARHGPMVAATCRAVLRDLHDVEDAFQATFLVLARKAGSIRAGDALGGWLHRVAYRAAVQRSIEAKRRRTNESEVSAMEIPDAARPALDFDVRSILHEEIDQLPEAQRLPVVLCDLEGLTYERAAGQLHWTMPTLYHRLAKGRKRLRDRLIRRGVTAASVVAAMELSRASATAAVPAAWTQAALAAATGGPVPAAVAALTQTLIRSLIMTRLKLTTLAVLAIASLASAGVLALGAARTDTPGPAAPTTVAVGVLPVVIDEPETSAKPGSHLVPLTIEARDLTTDAPIPGVRFELSGWGGPDVKTSATSDASGAARCSLPVDVPYLYVGASREGFVPQAIRRDHDANEPAPPDHLLFQMERATTVRGRVVDQDGKPIAGATVMIDVSKKYPGSRQWVDLKYDKAQADAEGRWSFSGVPEKPDSVKLAAYHALYLPDRNFFRMEDFQPLSALRDGSATLRLQRGTPIEGTVRAANGRPVADAEVFVGEGRRYANAIPPLKTDARGRFALGLPRGTISALTARAPGFSPALQPIRVGSDPLRVELTLPPPHVLKGRVVDPEGKPIAGAQINVAWSGPGTSGASGRGEEALSERLTTDADGRFAWKDAPERGIRVTAWARGFAATKDLSLDSDVDHRVVLSRPTTIKGIVLDDRTGRPIPRFSLMLGAVWNAGAPLIWQRGNDIDKEAKKAPGSFEHSLWQPAHQYIVRVSADGHLPADSGRFSLDGTAHTVTFRLAPAEPIRGTVRNPDGSAAREGLVYVVPPQDEESIEYIELWNGDVPARDRRENERAKVGPDGRFSLPPQGGNFALLALADAGFAIAHRRDLRGDAAIRLQPWARVSGTVMLDGKPAANLELSSQDPDDARPVAGEPRIERRYDAKTDSEGRFELRRVMPGRLLLGRWVPNGVDRRIWFINMATADVASGRTYNLAIGRSGRRVTGRLALPGKGVWMIRKAEIVPRNSGEKRPASIGVQVFEDGRLQAQDLPPGDYVLRIALHEPPPADACGWGRLIAAYSREFTASGTADDRPIDLGSLPPVEEHGRSLKVGDIAPEFAVKTLDGQGLSLADFRGQFVLLDFWATWCAPCLAELPNLAEVHKAFGADPRFALVSLSLDESADDAASVVKAQKMAWHQGTIGPDSPVASAYGATAIPATFLIGPDGRILAMYLRGERIKAAVAAALKGATRSP